MSNAHIARHWGFKAAQSGLPNSSNPYSNPLSRAAWDAGYRQVFAKDGLTRSCEVSIAHA